MLSICLFISVEVLVSGSNVKNFQGIPICDMCPAKHSNNVTTNITKSDKVE